MYLPPPALAFTIPSIHDDTTLLDCRIHHPPALAPTAPPSAAPWPKHAAIVAHPYASLGGSYDDPVVEAVSAALLRQGYIVGTFNFRGAGHSTGRTSWTGKAERADFASFVAFVAYYLHHLDPPASNSSNSNSSDNPPPTAAAPVLLLCGYSYGAMVTQHLAPLAPLLATFSAPPTASAAADIRLRAQHLAEKQNTILASAAAARRRSNAGRASASSGGLRVGGDEDPRRSQEHASHHRRSFSVDAEEKIRKGVAELLRAAKGAHHHHHHHHRDRKSNTTTAVTMGQKHGGRQQEGDAEARQDEEAAPTAPPEIRLPPVVPGLVMPRVAYLLVSPPVGWATNLMTMNLGGFFSRSRPKAPKARHADADAATGGSRDGAERQKLVDNPTLAIYGDADVFVAVKRFRQWAATMQAEPGSNFRAHEISTAGHFYVEEGTLQRLVEAVEVFSGNLVASKQAQLDTRKGKASGSRTDD